MSRTIEWVGAHPDNYEIGGAVDPKTGIKYTPIAIVVHIMEGTLDGTITWFNNPDAQASTNYGVGKDGRIVQFVKEGIDRPFANGLYCKETWKGFIRREDGSIVNPNRYTISIEHEGKTGEPFTEEMYQSTLWLQKQLIEAWNIPIDREHIIGHNQIDACTRPNCPGIGFPWDRLMAELLAWKAGKTTTMNTMATVMSDALNIRSGATDTVDNIVGKLVKNDRVNVISTEGQWSKIDLVSYVGYVWSEYLKLDAPVPVPVANPIMGKAQAKFENIVGFIQNVNPRFDPDIAKAFLTVGAKYGIRGDVALVQSLVETGWFNFDDGTAVTPDQHNYCGMGVTSKGMKGASFATIKDGVTAQIQHLFAYASTLPLPNREAKLDPRFDLVTRGIAPGWEDLSNRWAMNADYGTHILSIYKDMLAFVPAPVFDRKKTGLKAVASLVTKKIIDSPNNWTADKMLEPAPIWLVMLLIDRSTK